MTNVRIYDEGVDVTDCYRVTIVPGTLTILRRQVTLRVDSASFRYNGKDHSVIWTADPADAATGLVAGETLSAVLSGATRRNIGQNAVVFVPEGTRVTGSEGENSTGNYELIYKSGTIAVTSVNVKYTVEYYYDGVRDDSATVKASGKVLTTVKSYPAKDRDGMRLRKVTGLPLKLALDEKSNVIRVYYGTISQLEEIMEAQVPLSGSMAGLNAGDCME